MTSLNRHIVSSLQWSTSFDRKDMTAQLQDRISSWSKISVQKIFAEVFDKMCPPDQTWRIETLEVDLGPIDYNELEPELSLRLKKQLAEKLSDLITYSATNGSGEIEILEEETSHLVLLQNFLLHGFMSWQHTTGSADSMMMSLLKNSHSATMDMLWEVGSVHGNVRKRMAWQFSEPVVIKIIEGLEPNNHEEIVEFSEEMVSIQEKETIVETSVTAFKKDLWVWVLNYLFDDRGTIYNRVAFMKSTIRQMASHYNIRYEELFDLIDRAVEKLNDRSSVHAGFVTTLKVLSDETRAAKQKEMAAQEPATDHWYVFEVLLRDPAARRSGSRLAEFNDLIISLYRADSSRFNAMVLSLGDDEDQWTKIIADLQEPALENLLMALLPAKAEMMTKTVYFLHELTTQQNLHIERKAIWHAAVIFGLHNRHTGFDTKTFIGHCVSALVSSGQLAEEYLFRLLCGSDVPAAVKSIATIELYQDLAGVVLSREEKESHLIPKQLRELIDKLAQETNARSLTRKEAGALQETLAEQIRRHPKMALEVFIGYPEKNKLRAIFSLVVNPGLLQIMLKNAQTELQSVVATVESALVTLRKKSEATGLSDILENHLLTWTLEAIVFNRETTPGGLLRFILGELQAKTSGMYVEELVALCTELRGRDADPNVVENILSIYHKGRAPGFAERVRSLLREPGQSKETIGRILSAEFSDPAFERWRRSASQGTAAVLNYLLPDGEKWLRVLMKKYRTLLMRSSSVPANEVETTLRELYWKCVLDIAEHKGDAARLKKSFDVAVHFRFGRMNRKPAVESKKTASGESILLKNGEKLAMNELFSLIGKCMATGAMEIAHQGKRFEWAELFNAGLEIKHAAIRRMIAGLTPGTDRIRLLKATGSFRQFSMWIMSDLHGEMNMAMETMRLLYDVVTSIATGKSADQLLDDYWEEAWRLVRRGSWTQDDLKKLIRISFTKMAHDMNIHADEVIAEIRKKNMRLTPLLRNSLIACFPAFSSLPEHKGTKNSSYRLAEFESKGLLENLGHHLIVHQQVPSWSGTSTETEVMELLNEMIASYPVKFLQILKREVISESQMRWLNKVVNFGDLVHAVGYLNKDKQVLTGILGEFYVALGKTVVVGISSGELQEIIFRKLVKAWVNNNWKIISTEQVWNELMWDVCVKHGIPKKNFLSAMEKAKSYFPPAMQIALGNIKELEKSTRRVPAKTTIAKPVKGIVKKATVNKQQKTGIAVKNAGIVLLSSYIQMLFERLGMVSERKFVSSAAQNEAVHYLQYVITGLSRTEESLLPLNKVLCGLPISHPVQDGITVTDDQKKLIDGLIKAAIGHWPAIGDTSIDGFRGNWLVRDGLLVEQEDKWELIIEKRPYDVLIHKSPFAFSIIRYMWMEKPLHVTWPY